MSKRVRNLDGECYYASASHPAQAGHGTLRIARIWLFLFLLLFSGLCFGAHQWRVASPATAFNATVRNTATAFECGGTQEDDRAFLRYRGIQGLSLLRGRTNTSKHESISLLTPTAWFLAPATAARMVLPLEHICVAIAPASSVIRQFIICALPCRAGP
jgi:hypothetical protein